MSSTLSTKTTTQTTSTNFTSSVSISPTPTTLTTSTTSTTTNIKPCCACPETKRNRDQCIFETGDEEKCKDLIEAHKACMRNLGFNI
ncbi:COX17-domain-containing protein [Rhizophagus irregularis]|uniref:COX17-domain-containing protein n=2 Tax=Rhizophagus irregularis TaxID=588596 RepID=A0A2I1E7I1_9GLOM|nr:cytochrome C oxidase copper chaperone-domain-containing protein [Rhizophagus irregularis DAOM 181602=DAOM 197198]PKC09755.1 COX17-domain-containing protein [Rhizophagus irregularis]PKC69438.1 COX17-domain-containing protein [Rhizophagus irregularis]PKK73076.1 COX17-domain-containing protein [Rhizophagus irregularis]PKY18071.1 COX17-domain-containing protein [Rhizophagus irregularis]POG80129.1 cytochrome C oxidase copper chaperone-domain-containing protein [Rhizophagus irregularis DAOM 18160|eukprot:XP_025186995.1 cytochrome C oxidase copper chaperone-domain-containing protein [Rhizophagus irregularis DAOM 181602=DAOM 197198]